LPATQSTFLAIHAEFKFNFVHGHRSNYLVHDAPSARIKANRLYECSFLIREPFLFDVERSSRNLVGFVGLPQHFLTKPDRDTNAYT